MQRSRLIAAISVFACTALPADAAGLPQPPGRGSSRELVASGRVLFTMNFARPDEVDGGAALGQGGNGLGPVYNETSCAGCHNQAGVGGGGTLESNVLLMGIVRRPAPDASVREILKLARQVHPGFSDTAPILVVHRFALGRSEDTLAYDAWRDKLLRDFGVDSSLGSVRPVRRRVGALSLEIAQRNSTALWGVGKIDKFRAEGGEIVRRRVAQEQTERHPWITGRPPLTVNGQEGWFGWRGQLATLDEFVRSACATEMGLQVPGFAEAPLRIEPAAPRARAAKRQAGLDLTDLQCAALESFVHSLPAPEALEPSDPLECEQAHAGQRVFERVGCSDCHVPDLGWVRGIYSDLLLHDMGDDDEDAQIAVPSVEVRTSQQLADLSTGGYLGSSLVRSLRLDLVRESTEIEQEWKTPPLWGVSDSAPYLHDGRAATLKEAVELHAGEAATAAEAFRKLDPEDRVALMTFLQSLKAPQREPVALAN